MACQSCEERRKKMLEAAKRTSAAIKAKSTAAKIRVKEAIKHAL